MNLNEKQLAVLQKADDFFENSLGIYKKYDHDKNASDKCHGATEIAGKTPFKKGDYPIRVEYFENQLNQELDILYETGGMAKKNRWKGRFCFTNKHSRTTN